MYGGSSQAGSLRVYVYNGSPQVYGVFLHQVKVGSSQMYNGPCSHFQVGKTKVWRGPEAIIIENASHFPRSLGRSRER